MSDFLPTGIQLSYLVAVSLFIIGLKQLGSPATARNGNLLASGGMLLAVGATLLDRQVLNYEMILVGLAIGSLIGAIAAQRVAMTEMPQMVGLLNGLGGLASALVARGHRVRMYCPYGELLPGMSYLIRRLLENTASILSCFNLGKYMQKVQNSVRASLALPEMLGLSQGIYAPKEKHCNDGSTFTCLHSQCSLRFPVPAHFCL